MIVYPDLAFLLGVLIHGGILYLTIQLCDLPLRRVRYTIAVAVSALESALYCIPTVPFLPSVVVGILCYGVVLQGKRFLGTLRNLLTAFVILLSYCGAYIVISALLFPVSVEGAKNEIFLILGFFPSAISVLCVFCGGLCTMRILKRRRGDCGFVTCSLSHGTVAGTFRCLVDSGNLLHDPLSGVPVVVVEYDVLQRIFGKSFPEPMTYAFSELFGNRMRVLPVRTVAGEGEMLCGFVPEEFRVDGVPRKVVLAVTARRLEERGRFEGIMGIDLTQGGVYCESLDAI